MPGGQYLSVEKMFTPLQTYIDDFLKFTCFCSTSYKRGNFFSRNFRKTFVLPFRQMRLSQTALSYDQNEFDNSTPIVIGSSNYTINGAFNGSSVDIGSVTYYLGQSFTAGLAVPDINTKSGEIIYVDNRSSVTRASQQREDIKIVLEF